MPTYEYQCEKCGHRFDYFQSMKDDKLKYCLSEQCPESSGKGEVKRLLGTGSGLIFKGGGFYETDYRTNSYMEGAKKEKEGQGNKPKTEGKAKEAKPAEKVSASSSKPAAS